MKQYDIIRSPLLTEKTGEQTKKHNQVSFKVDRKSNRVEIKDAVEKNFNTRVKQVRTMQVKGKVKQRSRIIGKRKDWKKAIVTLMPGHRINFFDGV